MAEEKSFFTKQKFYTDEIKESPPLKQIPIEEVDPVLKTYQTNERLKAIAGNIILYETVVDASGNGDYTTIQDALNAEKKRIYVRAGIYNIASSITISKSDIYILGESSKTTILQTSTNISIISITNSSQNIGNITIENIYFEKTGIQEGNGIYVWGNVKTISNVDIKNCNFKNLSYGIYSKSSAAGDVSDILITDCLFESNANGIYCLNAGFPLKINFCFFKTNTTGIQIAGGVQKGTMINSCLFSANTNYGIYLVDGGNTAIIGNTIIGNDIGIGVVSHDDFTITGNTITFNNKEGIKLGVGIGGEIYHGVITGNEFRRNSNSLDNGYSHILVNGSGDTLSKSTIVANVFGKVYSAEENDAKYAIEINGSQASNFLISENWIDTQGVGYILNSGTDIRIINNPKYNPVGTSSITVGASPFTYTAGSSPETIYIRGGTVSNISKNSTTLFTETGHTIELEPLKSVVITYSSIPTMIKNIN